MLPSTAATAPCSTGVAAGPKVPDEFEPGAAATAVRIAEAMFPDGLKFTQLPYKLEWAQSQARLDAADKLKLPAEFAKLGGAAFLKAVSTAHARYGKALGITAQKPEAEGATVRARITFDFDL